MDMRIGLIGCGGISGRHLPELASAHGAVIWALCDIDTEKLNRAGDRYGVPPERRYTDYRQLIDNGEVDAVDICTPNYLHVPLAGYAAERGKRPQTMRKENKMGAVISKADWRLLRTKIAEWQERYMAQLIQQYIQLLSDESRNPSDRFWDLEKQVKNAKKHPGVLICLEKANAVYDIVSLIQLGVISFEDLADFSDGLKECVQRILSLYMNDTEKERLE